MNDKKDWKAIDSVINHFNAHDIRKIEVPEWKGKDGGALIIYVTPFTLTEKQRVFNRANVSDVGALADIVIMKAQDEKGKNLFTLEDKPTLMQKADADIVARIANEITTPKTDLQSEKKIKNRS